MAGKNGKSYLVEVEPGRAGTEGRPAVGPVYKSSMHVDFNPPRRTLYENFNESVAKYSDQYCIGHREGSSYKYLTFKETEERVAAVAGAMMHVGMQPHGRAAVYGANCPEWMITMQACNRQTIYCVPLYDSLGDNTVDYIIDHSESTIVFVSSAKLAMLAKALPKVAQLVKNVVYWGQVDEAKSGPAIQEIRGLGVPAYSFDEFLQLGTLNPAEPVPPKPEDLCTIMYTSGTTGTPKGVLLTHLAVANETASLEFWFDRVGIKIGPQDVYLSFLPLAHIYDRCMEEAFMHLGGCIGYWSGDVKGLPADIQACQPTIFCSVPRVYERFYSTVMDKVKQSGFFKRALFHWAFNRKLAALKAGKPWDKAATGLDKRIFSKISRQMLGPRIRLMTSGGGPLARHIEDFMRVTSCANFLQGYGLTETCAASFVDYPDEPDHMYSVGPPQPVLQLRLEAVPEMDYTPLGSPPRGEVLVKGGTLFSGYYKNEEEMRKAMDEEGWFHTGDVGELTPTGSLRIIDRKKNIFKLSQGEYIAIEKVEGVLLRSPFVEQIWAHGSHFESCLVAVVVPAKAKLEAWAKEQGIEGGLAQLCEHSQVKRMLLKDVEDTGRKGGLKGFELPKALYLEPEAFTVEAELLTPTFKLRRPQLLKKYGQKVDAMYSVLNKGPAKPSKQAPAPAAPAAAAKA